MAVSSVPDGPRTRGTCMTSGSSPVDINTGEVIEAPYHRSDICQVPPACVIGEAMMALVLAHAALEKFGGDHISETRRNMGGYVKSHQEFGQPPAATERTPERAGETAGRDD